MDYRAFELANDSCKPKHFGPPTALQRRLAYDAAHRAPHGGAAKRGWLASVWRWLRRTSTEPDPSEAAY